MTYDTHMTNIDIYYTRDRTDRLNVMTFPDHIYAIDRNFAPIESGTCTSLYLVRSSSNM